MISGSTVNPAKGLDVIDLHCHILPGLDDGADGWGASLEMAQIAAMDGISGIVCTPHASPVFRGNHRNVVLRAVEEFRTRLLQAQIRLELYPGCELAIDPNLPQKIESGELLTINDNRKIAMIEMPVEVIPPNLDRFFWMMRVRGINTILAHPERNYPLMKNPSVLLEWIQAGVLVQITGASLRGHYGQEIQDFSMKLLRHRMVHLVASDSHGPAMRRPVLSKARAITQSIVGPEEAHRIFYEYPVQVLQGEVPDVLPAIPLKKKTPFIRRIFPFR
ncbi:MAG: CpsB/CapC family capsule biosynthesis tyrosine phosphatase [Syntrophobacteraceae bacterium]